MTRHGPVVWAGLLAAAALTGWALLGLLVVAAWWVVGCIL